MKKVNKEKHKLVISRKRWVNGSNNDVSMDFTRKNKGESCLLNNKNNMCCLGFFAKSCGLKPKNIREIATPQKIINDLEDGTKIKNKLLLKINETPFKKLIKISKDMPIYYDSTKICADMMEVNDDSKISSYKREKKLTSLFKKINVDLEFVE